MAENIPKLMTDTKAQIHEAQRTPSRKIPYHAQNAQKHFFWTKDKEEFLKKVRENK